MKKLRAE